MTLTEILIVLGVLATVSAVALPMLGTWSRGDRLRGAARIIQSAMIGARERAVRDQTRCALVFDRKDGRTMYLTRPRTYAQALAEVSVAGPPIPIGDLDDVQLVPGRYFLPMARTMPIILPERTRFDLGASLIRHHVGAEAPLGATGKNRYVMFNPTGTAEGPGMVLINVKDTTEVGEQKVVVLFSRTGLVEVYDVQFDAATGAPLPFGFVDQGARAGG